MPNLCCPLVSQVDEANLTRGAIEALASRTTKGPYEHIYGRHVEYPTLSVFYAQAPIGGSGCRHAHVKIRQCQVPQVRQSASPPGATNKLPDYSLSSCGR